MPFHFEPGSKTETSDAGAKKIETVKIEPIIEGVLLFTREMVSKDGVPSKSVIKSSWCTTFFPGNNGFPVNTSAKMQPILHISIAGVYYNQETIKIKYIRIEQLDCTNEN